MFIMISSTTSVTACSWTIDENCDEEADDEQEFREKTANRVPGVPKFKSKRK
jgi:hypothetical protein